MLKILGGLLVAAVAAGGIYMFNAAVDGAARTAAVNEAQGAIQRAMTADALG